MAIAAVVVVAPAVVIALWPDSVYSDPVSGGAVRTGYLTQIPSYIP